MRGTENPEIVVRYHSLPLMQVRLCSYRCNGGLFLKKAMKPDCIGADSEHKGYMYFGLTT